MESFKEVFVQMAIGYAEYVKSKIETRNQNKATTKNGTSADDYANSEDMVLMNEVRTVNVIATTLTRMNASKKENYEVYSTN